MIHILSLIVSILNKGIVSQDSKNILTDGYGYFIITNVYFDNHSILYILFFNYDLF